ncbi:MAG: response regulator [Vicingaceae bacterium]|nr:response regulator [Vicingaceae bacterium]
MKKTKIFITEDEFIVSQNLKNKLITLGYDVTGTASSGEEALEKIKDNQPDLILMDIMLSGKMDGIDTAKVIKQNFNIPLIFLTAYSSKEIYQRAEITEPYAYILKPFEERELEINISIALYKHDTEKKLKEKQHKLEQLNNNLDKLVQERTLELIRKNNDLKQEIENRIVAQNKERRLASVIEQAEDHILITNINGKIEYVNPKMLNFLGYKESEIIGKTPHLFKSGKYKEEFYQEMWDIILSGSIYKGEIFNKKKNGELYVAQLIIVPLMDSDKQITHFAAIARDITDKRNFEKRMVDIQENEKERISKELHDGIGQMVTAIKYSLTAVFKESSNVKELSSKHKKILTQIDDLIKELRLTSYNLLPSLLRDYGLESAIGKIIKSINERKDLNISFFVNLNNKRFNEKIELGLFRIVQEAINNIVKHANAKKVEISLEQKNNHLKLIIKDNGIGFKIDKIIKGQGLSNMKQRAYLLDGICTINSNKNGTVVIVEIPLV